MRFGVCAPMELAPTILAAGFDYVEIATVGFVQDEAFDPNRYRAAGAEVSNLFFPGSLRLTPEGRNEAVAYAQEAIRRAHQIGIQLMVIGSGGSRRAEDGRDVKVAETFFVDLVGELQRFADEFQIRLAPESLNRTETNVGNDHAKLARELQALGAGHTADSYHILFEARADDPTAVVDWGTAIPIRPDHVHIADAPRNPPRADDADVQGFAARLRDLGYDGRVSVESRRANDEPETFHDMLSQLRLIFP